ncbi:Trans-aconitate 3-methyltransferase like protein [Verticillium longisporum]|uniref:Trans-aconitate 3-methyltransferase like protein n=1 Tax=Verticillium longisporum TaxID=100787 RepID=A0A8I2ZP43_VERLO|nr:Trans-aconitate 3-methyltransferase like protein [Verticillium longisporum]
MTKPNADLLRRFSKPLGLDRSYAQPSLQRAMRPFARLTLPLCTLLDLGCGHGLIARALSPEFGRVVAIEPSGGMVKQASKLTDDPKITFRQASSEDLSFVPDASVDLVVAGQASHWFDYTKAWPELARVVRSGGSLAFWGYKDNILLGFPEVNQILEDACYGEDEVVPGMESMAAYWEKPGRDILRDSLRAVVPPPSDWTDIQRMVFEPDRKTSSVAPENEDRAWLQKRLKLGEFEGYLRTFSAFSGWREAHPASKSRADGGRGDVVDVVFDKMIEAVPAWKAKGEAWREVEVDAVWGTVIILAKRA